MDKFIKYFYCYFATFALTTRYLKCGNLNQVKPTGLKSISILYYLLIDFGPFIVNLLCLSGNDKKDAQ